MAGEASCVAVPPTITAANTDGAWLGACFEAPDAVSQCHRDHHSQPGASTFAAGDPHDVSNMLCATSPLVFSPPTAVTPSCLPAPVLAAVSGLVASLPSTAALIPPRHCYISHTVWATTLAMAPHDPRCYSSTPWSPRAIAHDGATPLRTSPLKRMAPSPVGMAMLFGRDRLGLLSPPPPVDGTSCDDVMCPEMEPSPLRLPVLSTAAITPWCAATIGGGMHAPLRSNACASRATTWPLAPQRSWAAATAATSTVVPAALTPHRVDAWSYAAAAAPSALGARALSSSATAPSTSSWARPATLVGSGGFSGVGVPCAFRHICW